MGRSHIEVLPEDPTGNPHCRFHGPAIRMSESFDDGSPTRIFLACSANRDRTKCLILKNTLFPTESQISEQFEQRLSNNLRNLNQIFASLPENRGYCGQCECLVSVSYFEQHRTHRAFRSDLSDRMIKCPTTILAPLDNDVQEAQYFFSDQTLDCLADIFKCLDIRKVICIGAPRLHEYLRYNRDRLSIASVLLDLDHRLEQFFDRKELFMFNMFNHHFMDGDSRHKEFEEFLNNLGDGQILLFTDPPFGCRTELLALTISKITRRFQTLNALLQQPLPTMWIFPYFMETYVQQAMPEMQMVAYRVNYTNHRSYHAATSKGGRKQGSPIRIFTNIPLGQIPLPASEGYVQCVPCERWTFAGETHCAKCRDCPSKNGAAYVHCAKCATCVKPNYKHCDRCARCTQIVGHVCAEYVTHLTCWICRTKGHNEQGCKQWLAKKSGRKMLQKCRQSNQSCRLCLLCGCKGHNELVCPKRAKLLVEHRFMNEVFNIFTPK